jgi:hypothetical protein
MTSQWWRKLSRTAVVILASLDRLEATDITAAVVATSDATDGRWTKLR